MGLAFLACKDFLTEVQARLWFDLKLQPWLPGSSRDLSFFLYNSYLKGPSSLELVHLLVIPLSPMLKWHLTEDEIIPPHIAWLPDIRFNIFYFHICTHHGTLKPKPVPGSWMNEEILTPEGIKKLFHESNPGTSSQCFKKEK